jgi:hypothetical protein
VAFTKKPARTDEERQEVQGALVEMLLDADETERKRLLLFALQTGEVKMSEANDLMRLVERLEQIAAPHLVSAGRSLSRQA